MMVSKSTLALMAAIAALGAASPAFAQDAYNVPQYNSQRGQVIIHRDPLYDLTVISTTIGSSNAGTDRPASRGNRH